MDYTKMDDNQILVLGRSGDDEAMEFMLQKYGYLVKREVRTVYLIGAETKIDTGRHDRAVQSNPGLPAGESCRVCNICNALCPQTDTECYYEFQPQETRAVKFVCFSVYECRGQ